MKLTLIQQIQITAAALKRPTVLSIAFLRAAGLPIGLRMSLTPDTIYSVDCVDDEDAMIVECFNNHGSPMNL